MCCAVQGGVPERPVLVQWPGTGPSFYMRQPPYMQAAVAPNNQARPAATGLALQPGAMAWYVISHYFRHLGNRERVSCCSSFYSMILMVRQHMKSHFRAQIQEWINNYLRAENVAQELLDAFRGRSYVSLISAALIPS